MRGYGPFHEGAEPTAPVPAQPTGAEQPSYTASASSSGPFPSASEQPRPAWSGGPADEPTAPVSPQTADVPPFAQNGETPTAATEALPPQAALNYDQRAPAIERPHDTEAALNQPTYDRHTGADQSTYDQHGTFDRPPFDPPTITHPVYDQPGSGQPAGSSGGYVSASGAQPGYPHPAGQPDPHGAPGPGYDPAATTSYPPQPTTPYPTTPTAMTPYVAAPAEMNPHGGYPVDPTSGTPTSGTPASGVPASGVPASGAPASGAPTSGSPYPTSGGAAYGPFRVGAENTPTSGAPDPYDFSTPSPFASRRIEPSPPPDRSRLLIGIVAGLVAGLLVFGAGGWFAGRATAPDAAPKPTPTAAPTSTLGVFEQSQVALNQPYFAATGLVTISQGWLPYLASCARSGEPGGPALSAGEKTRVRCTLDGMSAIFVEYNSISDRDKARVKTLGQNVDARTLTPGVGAATQRATPSGRTNGNYVEYAYKLTEGGVTRPVAAVWWDDAQTPVAGYLLAYWKEGLGESWDPMRDLWARYA